MAKVLKVYVERVRDENPNLSFLGVYSDTLDPKGHIDLQARNKSLNPRRDYRYFNVGTADPEYIEQIYERMKAYHRGDWWMTGIRACADIQFAGGQLETIQTPGLWGIESDCGEDYIKEVAAEELHTLKAMLAELRLEFPTTGKLEVIRD